MWHIKKLSNAQLKFEKDDYSKRHTAINFLKIFPLVSNTVIPSFLAISLFQI